MIPIAYGGSTNFPLLIVVSRHQITSVWPTTPIKTAAITYEPQRTARGGNFGSPGSGNLTGRVTG
jgi:hypothetical protein